MRKSIYRFGMLAAAALTFFACAKEIDAPEKAAGTHTVEFSAVETKTAVVEGATEASFVWTTGDEQYFHIFENGIEATSVTKALDSDGLATFTATFTDTEASEFTYSAQYYKEVSKSGNILTQKDQNPGTDSFDPSADALISVGDPTVSGSPAKNLQFVLRRVVSVNKVTLKGLVSGEKVSEVEISSDKNLVAYYVPSSENYSAKDKKLTLSFSDVAVPESGQLAVYFTCAPVEDASFEIKVTTDKNIYTRNDFSSKVTFSTETMKRFGVNLSGYGTPKSTAVDYKLISSTAELPALAEVIIVNGTNAMAEQKTNNRGIATVSAAVSNVISIDNSSSAHVFTLESTADGYTLLDKDGTSGYLYSAGTASNNYLRSMTTIDDACYWEITISDGTATIKSVNNEAKPYIRFNSNLFSCYKDNSSYASVSLYVNENTIVERLATPDIDADVTGGNTIYVTWSDVANADSYIVTCTGQSALTVGAGVEEATFAGLADGNYTVTVTATSSSGTYADSKPATVANLVVGTPTLETPVNVTVAQTSTGISASWDAVENASSYSWTLYDDAELTNPVAGATVSTNSLTAEINATDWLISSLDAGTTYYFTVSASASGYNPSAESAAASFTAKSVVSVTIPLDSSLGITNGSAFSSTKSSNNVITVAGAKGSNSNAPKYYSSGDAVRFYGGNTITISGSVTIVNVTVSFGTKTNGISKSSPEATLGTYDSAAKTQSWSGSATSVTLTFAGTSGNDQIKSVEVTYEKPTGGTDPVKLEMGTISCTDSGVNENSLTWSWAAVDGADGYQVSEDGTTYGSTQTALTYTRTGLSAGASYSIYVKAIGDGTNYTTSDPKQSAAGTTKTSEGGKTLSVGDVLFEETWGSATGAVSSYDFSGTKTYDGTTSSLSYTATIGNNDKIDSATGGGITTNNYFFGKSDKGTLNIDGIKLEGATAITVSYDVNRTNLKCEYSLDGGSVVSAKSSSSSGTNSFDITTSGNTTLKLIFQNTSASQNSRLDNIKVVVKAID